MITITCFCHIFQLEKNLNRSWSWEKKSVKIFFSFQNNNNCWKARIQFNLIRFELKINKQTNKKTFPGISSTITYIILPKCFFFGHFFDYSKKIKKKRFKNSNLISKKKHTAHKYVIGKIDLAKYKFNGQIWFSLYFRENFSQSNPIINRDICVFCFINAHTGD